MFTRMMENFILVFYFWFIGRANSELPPIEFGEKLNVFDAMIPTVRQTLDDCSTRYYRYGHDYMDVVTLGTPVELSEFSHFVAIGWTQSENMILWNCGGSLISDNFVLTAAHCTSYRSIQPDKALLGDRFPNTTADDEFAQQFNIAEVIAHERYRPSLRYYDIGLIRLDKNIVPHKTVLPACLWNSDTYLDFKNVEAIGIGQTGFGDTRRNGLEKVTLGLIELTQCREFHNAESDRRLNTGLLDHQLCARGNQIGDLRPDTCLGDSGGPLQVKLLANGRITSFIVGITSFGKGCGSDAPGVYTKVATFIQWIEEKLDISFDPRRCALRYVSLREFQPGLLDVENRFGGTDNQQIPINEFFSKIHITREYRHKAYLGKEHNNLVNWYCGASLISEKWLLTTAYCASQEPDIVSVGGLRLNSTSEDPLNQKREIEEIVIHPSYKETEVYHDIALIKMQDFVNLSLSVVPACIWKSHQLPTITFEVVGWGSQINNLFFIDDDSWEVEDDEIFPIVLNECNNECQVNKTKTIIDNIGDPILDELRYLEINSTILDNRACNQYYAQNNQFEIINHQLCLQNDFFVVPGICDLDIGGQVGRKIRGYNGFDSFIFGLNSYGNNCGFGTPLVATRVSSYWDWIERIVLEINDDIINNQINDEQMLMNQPTEELEINQCHAPDICTSIENCPLLATEYKYKDRSVQFCAVQPYRMVCCPPRLLSNDDDDHFKVDLKKCASKYHKIRRRSNNFTSKYEYNKIFTHTAAIGFLSDTDSVEYKCWGALIDKKFVLTTASCLMSAGSTPVNVRLGNQNFELAPEKYTIRISKVIVHPWYNPNCHYYDIALLRMKKSVRLDHNVVPACLWPTEDHVPFIGVLPGPFNITGIKYTCTSFGKEKCESNDENAKEKRLLSMQKDECDRHYGADTVLPKGIISSQICAQSDTFNMTNSCVHIPGTLYQKGVEVNGVIVPYVIGLYSFGYECELDKPAVFTRISSFIEFIEEQLVSYYFKKRNDYNYYYQPDHSHSNIVRKLFFK